MNLKNQWNILFELQKHKIRTAHTKWAILGTTPGSESSSSIELGMSPSYFVRQIWAIFFKLHIGFSYIKPNLIKHKIKEFDMLTSYRNTRSFKTGSLIWSYEKNGFQKLPNNIQGKSTFWWWLCLLCCIVFLCIYTCFIIFNVIRKVCKFL
jgi:drug/metabolite transporter (DMT)-like permease